MATSPVTPPDYEIEVTDLTSGSPVGEGVFDKLMASLKPHLQQEYSQNRIKGPEYAEVYLGSLTTIMNTSMQFLMQKARIGLEAKLLEQQIILAELEVTKAGIAIELLEIEKEKSAAEVEQIKAQVELVKQQVINAGLEALNIPLQGEVLKAQAATQKQQVINLAAEALNIPKQGLMIDAQAAVQGQQKLNLIAEAANIPKQGQLLDAQVLNAAEEGKVLVAQACKLKAEFDLTMNKNTQTTAETLLIAQKTATEKAQVQAIGVDPDSVVGRQKALYKAQTDGFQRDAELKAAKLLVDTWSARRMSDEGTVADNVNKLSDANIGRMVQKVMDGVNA